MHSRLRATFFSVIALLATAWYFAEPWALTFVDDGPYFSETFSEPIDPLPVISSVQLRYFKWVRFTLESRRFPNKDESILVLWDDSGHLVWAKRPVKPDGELGSLRLREPHWTWNAGWRIRIVPSNQEPGDLYLNALGGLRFFNHSW